MNLLFQTDSYKVGHSRLYPPNLTNMYAYFESRGGKYKETVFFGLQYYLQKYLTKHLFLAEDTLTASRFYREHFVGQEYFDFDAWMSLYKKHGNKLPLRIKAVPEGTVVPTHNVLFTVESTDNEFPWLVGWVETLLMKVWYPITVATQGYKLKQQLRAIRQDASDNLDGLDFMVHDFGYRGCTSEEQAAIGGAAHLLNFQGTDTIAGIRMLQEHYKAGMAGYSVPATEHSIILAWGCEEDAFAHLLTAHPNGIVACVSDTWDIYKAVNDLWGNSLRNKVMGRDGTLVIRPDSGDPQEVVLRVLDNAAQRFGYSTNSKGYKVLDPHVRVIQGDGMTAETIVSLYDFITACGYAPENLTVGAGGGMLQSVNRDTQRFAYKVSSVERGGVQYGVAKAPITDSSKNSKAGRFKLAYVDGQYMTMGDAYLGDDHLETVFENGVLGKVQTLADIRERLST